MKEESTVYLIDGSAYIYRAYHAIRGLTNSTGFPTNAVFGFTRMILKLLEDRDPEFIGMVFDTKGPTFRHDLYDQYKANRPPMPDELSVQIPYIKQVTEAFRLPVLEMDGYEADDVIGTLSRQAQKAGFSVVMVTGDKDFVQLVSDRARIWDPMKEKTIDVGHVKENMGVEPLQMIDVQGLMGDSSDNIPGVPGIGPKTAIALIREFGSMEKLYEQVDRVTRKKQREKLIDYKEQALLSRSLVTIDTEVPLRFDPDAMRRRQPDNDRLAELFKELEFRQLQQAFSRTDARADKTYQAVLDTASLGDLVARLETAERFAVDTETTSTNPMAAQLVGVSVSLTPNEAFYIPVGHDYDGAPAQLDRQSVLDRLKPVLENPSIGKIGQNIKYDWIVLTRHGVNLQGVVFDTMLASYLLNPTKRAHNLDQIALDFLNHRTISYKEVAGKENVCFSKVSLEKAVPYASEDADITLMACQVLEPMLKEAGLSDLFDRVEMPLIPVLVRMEMAGIGVDRESLGTLSASFENQLEQLETDIFALAGESFNINSSQQLGRILFEKLGLPVQKKTRKKTGYSTDVEVLTTLAEQHDLPALVLRHRTLAKLKSTYADALIELIHPETGRIHTSYNQTVTATGRLSSSDPNLQNIPVRTEEGREIRRTFVPRPGWTLLSADYSQIELRILAHCSEDPILIQAFKDDEDIHTRTATEVFQVFPSFINDELRRQAKAINFGIVYGMSPYGLSRQLGISRKMAKTYIDNYFARYKGVKRFMDQAMDDARQNGSTSTLLGRIRLLPDINSSKNTVRQFAERIAINTPIQGTAADLIKLAMIQVDEALEESGAKTVMLLSVHDEIVFEVPVDELDRITELVRSVMENVWRLKVPLKVNVATGKDWADAH